MQENGHYPSHMFVIMTIHYLQQRIPPVLPVLQEVRVLIGCQLDINLAAVCLQFALVLPKGDE